MKNIFLALFLSLLIHLLFLFKYKSEEKQNSEDDKKIEKTDIKFVKLNEIKEQNKVEVEKPKQELPKEIKTEKTFEKPIEKKVEKVVEKSKKIEQKPIKNDLKEAKELQNKILKEQVVQNKQTIQDKTLENFLNQKEPVNKEILSELEKLYGKEYQSFTTVQKAYLEKNLNNFQVITQRVLNRMGYPKLAEKLRIGGVNIVEFDFHPNGNISNLKITSSSSYTILDDYTLELIEIAYKDYPKPTEKTKIKFQVFYRMY